MEIDTTPNKTDAGDDKSPRLIRNVICAHCRQERGKIMTKKQGIGGQVLFFADEGAFFVRTVTSRVK